MVGEGAAMDLDLPVVGGRQSLRHDVAEAIRASVISGRMKPGELYSAPKLAELFQVSATPVREAMLDMVSEGHFEAVKNKGYRVVEITQARLDELAEIRLLLEPPIMGRIARLDDADVRAGIEALRPLAQKIVTAAADRDYITYIDSDTRFHIQFLRLYGNDILADEVLGLRNQSRLFGLDGLAEAGLLEVLAAEHEQMVDLALAGDPKGLEKLVKGHIGHVRKEWAGHASG